MFSNNSTFFSSSKPLITSIKDTLTHFYENLPLNFSMITGWHHPGVSRLCGDPILGRLPNMTTDEGVGRELHKLAEVAKNDPRNLAYCSAVYKEIILLTQPRHIAQIMKFNQSKVTRTKPEESFAKVIGEHNVFTLPTNSEWMKKRTALKNWILTSAAMDETAEPMQKIIDEFVDIARQNGEIPSLELFMVMLTLDVFTRTRLGLEDRSTRNIAKELSDAFAHALTVSADARNTVFLKIAAILEYLHIKIITPFEKEQTQLHNIVRRLFLEPNQDLLRENFSILQKYFLDNIGDNQTAFDESIQDAAFMLFTGHETTARLLQFSFMLLAKHPAVLANLRKEIAANQPQDGVWTPESLEKMTYLRGIIKETLRLNPPIPLYPREVTDTFILGDIPFCNTFKDYEKEMANRDQTKDIVLHPGTIVFVSPWVTQRLESIYQHPYQFDPLRFKNNLSIDQDETYTWFPFGADRRNCIGRKFAVQEAALTLIKIAEKCDFELIKDYPEDDLKTYFHGTLKHDGEVPVKFIPRLQP